MPYKIPECLDCGVCCEKEQKWVEVSQKDAERMGDLSKKLLTSGDIEPFAMKSDHMGRCLAQDSQGKCSIYAKRPQVCRDVKRGSELCLYMLGWHRIDIIDRSYINK